MVRTAARARATGEGWHKRPAPSVTRHSLLWVLFWPCARSQGRGRATPPPPIGTATYSGREAAGWGWSGTPSATVLLSSRTQSRMAESTSVPSQTSVTDEDLRRAEEFTLEPFVHEGEERDEVLAQGTARRRALDDALAEIEAGRDEPSVEWRREYSLMLGLERLLSEDEPHLADGTTLNAAPGGRPVGHADRAARRDPERQGERRERQRQRQGRARRAPLGRERSSRATRRSPRTRSRSTGTRPPSRTRSTSDEQLPEQPEDPGASRRFWFEHATGAGKTVAAMGFVEASRTGGILILTHRRNLVDQFNGELNQRGYKKRASAGAPEGPTRSRVPTARSRSRPTSGSSATRATSPTRTRSSSATRRTPPSARRRAPRSATGSARSSSA